MAAYSELDIYYYTEDHIGRPLSLRDGDQVLMWYEQHYPFGEVIYEDTPNGDMTAGAGAYAITWKPNFRFPGQYQDTDMFPFTQNHYREYMPQFGRYNRVDPFILIADDYYLYAKNNAILYSDFQGKSAFSIALPYAAKAASTVGTIVGGLTTVGCAAGAGVITLGWPSDLGERFDEYECTLLNFYINYDNEEDFCRPFYVCIYICTDKNGFSHTVSFNSPTLCAKKFTLIKWY